MDTQKKVLLNFRPAVIISAGLILGILVGYCYKTLSEVWFACLFFLAIILLIVGITAKVALLSVGLLVLLLFIGVPIFTISINQFICKKLKVENVPGIVAVSGGKSI